jgi:myo-inositol-1(or 4)-monophosphatase
MINSPIINVMTAAAHKASRSLIRDYGEVQNLQVSVKGPGDFVSAADLKAEKILISELNKARPDFTILSEERGTIVGKDESTRWVIDPLDGTTNFLHGIPHFAISIGLEKNKEIIAGIIYDPIKDEMFYSEKGQGSFLNNQRIRVSSRKNLKNSIIATGIPWGAKDKNDKYLKQLVPIMDNSAGIRRFGVASLDLAYVASGRFDGYWESNLNLWDICAGILLVKEAGGLITDFEGEKKYLENKNLLASNSGINEQLLKVFLSI